jgi:hypothetical protein
METVKYKRTSLENNEIKNYCVIVEFLYSSEVLQLILETIDFSLIVSMEELALSE